MLSEFLKIGEYEIAYNGVRLADYFIVRGVDMPMHPPITTTEIQIDGKPGAWLGGRQLGVRDIVIRLGILSANRQRVEALEAWLNRAYLVSKEEPCRLDLGKGYWAHALLVGNSDITRNGKWSTVELTFRCFDPHIYRQEHTLNLASGSNKIQILGKAPVAPVFQVRSTSTSYLDIEDDTTKKKVRIYSPGSALNVHRLFSGLWSPENRR